MKVLVIGGAGRVASLVIPYLRQKHDIRVFDLRPPADTTLEYRVGRVTDHDAVRDAAIGCDALLYMAMGTEDWHTVRGVDTGLDANVKGVYIALRAAHEAGVPHAIYTSSLSVYDGPLTNRYFYDEDMPADGIGLYSFTKYLGELVCRNAYQRDGTSVNALRMCLPVSDERWQEIVASGAHSFHTAASDLARAMDAALAYRDGFQVFMISGDYEGKILNMRRAKRVLGWEPLARPRTQQLPRLP